MIIVKNLVESKPKQHLTLGRLECQLAQAIDIESCRAFLIDNKNERANNTPQPALMVFTCGREKIQPRGD